MVMFDFIVQVENSVIIVVVGQVQVVIDIYFYDVVLGKVGVKIGGFFNVIVSVFLGFIVFVNVLVIVQNLKFWGLCLMQEFNMYVVIICFYVGDQLVDIYEIFFGICFLQYFGDGLCVNGQCVYIQGVCQYYDFGLLGVVFNILVVWCQLEMFQDMGINVMRILYNFLVFELFDFVDKMGFFVLDEIFDMWGSYKICNDFQIIFVDWFELDFRVFVCCDCNYFLIWVWFFGNEVVEQGSSNGVV